MTETDQTLTQQLKDAARAAGADLVGIASIDRFVEIDPAHHPASIFPEAQSVIVVGKRIARGCLRGVEEATQFGLYMQYAGNWVPDRFLALTTVGVATFLEDQRWEAVPLPELPPEAPPSGVAVRDGAPAPNVMIDFMDAAVRAGVGRIGYNGELMTPEYGPRQRLQLILTDAPLAADPLCETNVCDLCKQCVAACPLDAMVDRESTDSLSAVTICGMTMPVAEVDLDTCRSCKNGALKNRLHPSGRPDRIGALCTRTCIHHIEEEGLVGNRFANTFRQRPAWRIDRTGEASLVEEA
ncbi:MAG: epoxyqueuosine reductase [bacterium]|nr:epoxyqueuosine reductase [bacterium]